MCESPLPLAACLLLSAVIVVAASSVAELVLELDVDTNVPRDDDILEAESASYGVEKEGVTNWEGKELEQVIVLDLGSEDSSFNWSMKLPIGVIYSTRQK